MALALVPVLLAFVTAELSGSTDAGAAPVLPACVQVRTEAVYVPFGYNHLVFLTSGCARPVTCTVSTDVNPEPTTVEVSPSTTVEVVTYRVAASSTFNARVSCAASASGR